MLISGTKSKQTKYLYYNLFITHHLYNNIKKSKYNIYCFYASVNPPHPHVTHFFSLYFKIIEYKLWTEPYWCTPLQFNRYFLFVVNENDYVSNYKCWTIESKYFFHQSPYSTLYSTNKSMTHVYLFT